MTLQAKQIRVEVGEIPKEKRDGVIYFKDFEEMNKILNAQRVKILETIKKEKPESIYQLAQMLSRDQGNVTKDVNLLHEYGFIEITKTSEGKRTKSVPEFEEEGIEMIIKFGAGMFGIAKDAFAEASEEFKDENLKKNQQYTKEKIAKTLKPLKNTVKKFAEEFDIPTKS